MRVLARAVYRGPHLYSLTPMVRLQLDLGVLVDRPTDTLPGFAPALLDALPGLRQHHCSEGVPGGFVRRLNDGTWMGHVVEHVALALQAATSHVASRGKTRAVRGRPGVYNVMYAYQDEALALMAGRVALELVDALLPTEFRGLTGLDRVHPAVIPGPFDLAAAQSTLRREGVRRGLGPTAAALVAASRARGIPVQRLDDRSFLQLGWGARQQRLRASITGRSPHLAVETAGNKALTKTLLSEAGLPAPQGVVVQTEAEAVREAGRLGGPVVTKPLNGNHGRGVSLELVTEGDVRRGFAAAGVHSRRVIVEQQFTGSDHRVLVVDGRVVAVAERVPAHVIGDGRASIAQLVERTNRDPRRGVGHEAVMTQIALDEPLRQRVAAAGLTLDSVPAVGVRVTLRDTANLSTGGTAVDRTDEIHPENAAICRRAAQVIGLDVAGIDFIAPDIGRSVRETGGGIIEVNAAPGFRMHLEPSQGRARDVARPVIDLLFPRGQGVGRIPVVAVTGTNGKSTTCRMLAHILRAEGLVVGLTTTSGVYIDDERVSAADSSGPKSAGMVLRDPTVQAAVLETARGGILREGLGFDRCDVGVVLNVSADHLGLGGIDTLEQLAAVKAVVVSAVARRGTSVLNADDPLTVRMARRAAGRLVWFSLRGGAAMPGFLRRHLARGGRALLLEPDGGAGRLVLREGEREVDLIAATDIPATLEGAAVFNVQNALAAAAAAAALGVPEARIGAAMATMVSDYACNPGRLNVRDVQGVRIIVDYAHNPAGLRALQGVIEALRPGRARVIGVVSIPGDRRDEDIRAMGAQAAAMFDDLIFREKPDGRGRDAGEVIRLLAESALAAGFPEARLRRVMNEGAAVDGALKIARPGDLVVLLPTDIDAVWAQVQAYGPPPADGATTP